MTPKEFIDENYFSLTLDCKREIKEIYQALEDYAETKQLTIPVVSHQRELLNSFAEEWNVSMIKKECILDSDIDRFIEIKTI